MIKLNYTTKKDAIFYKKIIKNYLEILKCNIVNNNNYSQEINIINKQINIKNKSIIESNEGVWFTIILTKLEARVFLNSIISYYSNPNKTKIESYNLNSIFNTINDQFKNENQRK